MGIPHRLSIRCREVLRGRISLVMNAMELVEAKDGRLFMLSLTRKRSTLAFENLQLSVLTGEDLTCAA